MATPSAQSDTALTEAGFVRGVSDAVTTRWLGVPYATAPTGAKRYTSALPVTTWEGIRNASTFGPSSWQPRTPMIRLPAQQTFSEQCLNLNIWSPADRESSEHLPVMVWIHGGASVIGSSAQPVYDGTVLSLEGRAVVVTLNYRLGILGALDFSHLNTKAHTFESNLGLKDIVIALRWVQRNIMHFGGDPDRVTLFGESAGAAAITSLMTAPQARGLFHRAIVQSAPATSVYGQERSAQIADAYLHLMDVNPVNAAQLLVDSPAEFLAESAMRLIYSIAEAEPGSLAYAPVVDGEFLPDYPVDVFRRGEQMQIPMVIGTNHNEAALFKQFKSPVMPVTADAVNHMLDNISAEGFASAGLISKVRRAYPEFPAQRAAMQISTDAGIRMPAVWLASAHSDLAATYMYRFDHSTPLLKALGYGAAHATELPYVFGTIDTVRRLPGAGLMWLGGLSEARDVSGEIRRRWLEFAHGDLKDWPAYDTDKRSTQIFGRGVSTVSDPGSNTRIAWGDVPISFR